MNPGTENKIASSFMFWLDHIISQNGGYTNYSGSFYNMPSPYYNHSIYGTQFSQFVADSSISGANVITGVYFNNTFITTGMSGLIDIDYYGGRTIFSGSPTYSISGNFAVKDFNIMLNNDTEENILFKTKYQLRPRYPKQATGCPPDSISYPVIIIKSDGGKNEPFAFGGTDMAKYNIRCIVLADSLHNLYSVQSILRESVRTPIALFNQNEQPYNVRGGLARIPYNYTGLANNKINSQQFMFIEDVTIPRQAQNFIVSEKMLNPDVFFNFVDLECVIFGDFRRWM